MLPMLRPGFLCPLVWTKAGNDLDPGHHARLYSCSDRPQQKFFRLRDIHVPATLAQSFPIIYQAILKDTEYKHVVSSSYLVGRLKEAEVSKTPMTEKMPWGLKENYSETLSTLRKIPIETMADITTITNENNFYSVFSAKMQMAYRDHIVRTLSANLLVN